MILCVITILTGTKKMGSQETTIKFYESVVQGVKGYHNTVLKDVEVNKCTVAPPPKVLLDYNNIPKYEKALLTSYRESPDPQNPYFIIKNGSHAKYYTLTHDGIQKFSHELNGSYIRTVNIEDDIEVKNVPWALTEIPARSNEWTAETSGTVPPVPLVPGVHVLDKDSCVPVVHVLDQSTTGGQKGGRPG